MTTLASTSEAVGELLSCTQCGKVLPLRPEKPGEKALAWACSQCGEVCHAVYADEAPREIAARALRHRGASPKKAASTAGAAPSTEPLKFVRKSPPIGHTAASNSLDRESAEPSSLKVANDGPAFLAKINKPGATPYAPEAVAKLTENQDRSALQIEGLIESLEGGSAIEGEAHESITRQTLSQAASDLDLFVRLGINPGADGYPGRHTLHVAMLATAIGANLEWDHQSLVDLGVGCLIHDIGMIDHSCRAHASPSVLTDAEFAGIAVHPLRTFDLLEDHFSRIPLASRMVAYQMHERLDGEGYPRRRSGALIHESAKVAALADVYVALVSPRPHRKPLMPYHAVRHLLAETQRGQFDPNAFRALLRTISFFPIGSWVELADGRVARVLRTNPADYTRPILEAWRRGETDAPAEIVDLLKQPKLAITKPITDVA